MGPAIKAVETIDKPASRLAPPPNLADYEKVAREFSWEAAKAEVAWFPGGSINAAYSAVDRRAEGPMGAEVALRWESADGEREDYTYRELSRLSNRFANGLDRLGVSRGDRVFIFAPRIPEVLISFLGTLKAGAIAGTLFSAFGPEALGDRLGDSGASMLVTTVELKSRIDEVRGELPALKWVVVVDRTESGYEPAAGEIRWDELMTGSDVYSIRHTDPEDPAFMLYTSGTTGKPKGVVHVHGGIAQQALTARWALDLKPGEPYWCTADHGWVTGICYGILGPLANGAQLIAYEGRFDPEEWYGVLERYRVQVWYTAPTAIRMLMQAGEDLPRRFDLSSLRCLNSVGEPLNPEAIRWGMRVFGLPFHDTWWQTETGSILIANYASMPIKVGSMGRPFPGIVAGIVDDSGRELPAGTLGNLAIRPGWPAMMRAIWGKPERYRAYFSHGWFITGDKAWRDADGYFWFVGRADDVIKTSGERVGPFEVESALIEHPAVAEAAVIGKPDTLRGEIIKAFVIPVPGREPSPELIKEIQEFVKSRLAGHAYPRELVFVDTLPHTRSGKILRRVLKARELGLEVGDLSTIEQG